MSKHTVRAVSGLLMMSAAATFGGTPFFGDIVMDAAAAIDRLQEQRDALWDESQALIEAADEAEADLSEEDTAKIEANAAKIERLDRQIAARKAMLPTGQGRRTRSEPANTGEEGGRRTVPAQPRRDDPRAGFASFGEFAVAVHGAARVARNGSGELDGRLRNAATTYGNEGTGADGGFAIPQEYRREIWQKVMAEENLLTRCDQVRTGANNITVPKDETTPWQTTGGIQVYWESEGSSATASKPSLEMDTMRLHKLMALVPISEELLDDAPGLESWMRSKAPAKIVSKVNTAVIRGTGVGQPMGILNADSLVSVAKESGQTADTVVAANINKMWSRLYTDCRRNAVWLINQDVEPQLSGMTLGDTPIYLPPGGLSATPYGTLKGRPVVPVQACSTIGDQGDVILADLTQYLALVKAGQDIRTDVSMHLYFDQALMAFRFIFRVNGKPHWGSSITPENGTNTLSWAVTLDARA